MFYCHLSELYDKKNACIYTTELVQIYRLMEKFVSLDRLLLDI